MKTIILGLFPSQSAAKNIATFIENYGFSNEKYIIYKTETPKLSFWDTLFGAKKIEKSPDEDKLIVSVETHDYDEQQVVKNIFTNADAVHIYEFENMTIEDAKSLDYIKKIVKLRAKSEIYALPEIVTSNSDMYMGINSEVKA